MFCSLPNIKFSYQAFLVEIMFVHSPEQALCPDEQATVWWFTILDGGRFPDTSQTLLTALNPLQSLSLVPDRVKTLPHVTPRRMMPGQVCGCDCVSSEDIPSLHHTSHSHTGTPHKPTGTASRDALTTYNQWNLQLPPIMTALRKTIAEVC